MVFGRDDSADIRVEDKKVSRRHAIFKLVDGELWVEDLGSANGVRLNGKRIQREARFGPGDNIKVGGYRISVKDLDDQTGSSMVDRDDPRLASHTPEMPLVSRQKGHAPTSAGRLVERSDERAGAAGGLPPVIEGVDDPIKGQRFELKPGENVIGRLEECDVPILDGSVSRQHARILVGRDRVSVTDLGASNGTFLNEARVEVSELAGGDVIRVGNIRLRVLLPPALSRSRLRARRKGRALGDREQRRTRRWALVAITGLVLASSALGGAVFLRWRGVRGSGWPAVRSAGGLAGLFRPGHGARDDLHLDGGAEDMGQALAAAPTDGGAKAGRGADGGAARGKLEPSPQVHADARSAAEKPAKDAGVADAGAARAMVTPDAGGATAGKGGRDAGAGNAVAVAPEPDDDEDEPEAAPSHAGPRRYPAVARTGTVTSPFGRRDGDGLPVDLPVVDETFDFDGFVTQKLATLDAQEKAGDRVQVKATVAQILAQDPINPRAREVAARLKLEETARNAFDQAEKLEAKGNVTLALKLYAAVPAGASKSLRAKAKVDELRPKAIAAELEAGDRELKSKASWLRAHRRFKDVLELDPQSSEALRGVRAVERKMRAKNMRFVAYIPPTAKEAVTVDDTQSIEDAIARRCPGDDELAKIARLYAQGGLPRALKKAEALEKKAEGKRKDVVKDVRVALKKIQTINERIRNEIGNDPNEAWARLVELERIEATVLPTDVKSYLRRELEESIAEAFAISGASLFDRGRLEEAFQRWTAGYKLDPLNPKVMAGLGKLEARATQAADQAELATQHGEKDACNQWRAITRMTRPDSDVYKRALGRARQICSP